MKSSIILKLLFVAALLLGPTLVSAGSKELFFFVTIDTETGLGCEESRCSPVPIEERILGLKDSKAYGIPLIMDILEKHGMKGTFFINAFLDSYYPENAIQAFVDPIKAHGHDIQLHTHEEFRCLRQCPDLQTACVQKCSQAVSFLPGNSYEGQLAILQEGASNIKRWSGKWPVAFRGGAYRADFTTLRALKTLNIPIDSSINGPAHLLAAKFPVNSVKELDGMIELPLSSFNSLNIGPLQQSREFDLEANTLKELKHLVEEAKIQDVKTLVMLMHSFSFCRTQDRCPHREQIQRFEDLLDFLSQDPDIHVITLSDFAHDYVQSPQQFAGSGHTLSTGYWLTLYRSVARFDDGWKNVLFVLANIAIFIGLVFAIVFAFIKLRFRKRTEFEKRSF